MRILNPIRTNSENVIAAGQLVRSTLVQYKIVSGCLNAIGPGAGANDIAAWAAIQTIVTRAPKKLVVARISEERIISGPAVEFIIAIAAMNCGRPATRL